jgi:hypothetical protein
MANEIDTDPIPQSCTFGVDANSIDDLVTLEPQGDIKSKSMSMALTHTMSHLDSFISSLVVKSGNPLHRYGNPTTTTTLTFSVPKNHLLDKVLFHQKYVPLYPPCCTVSTIDFPERSILPTVRSRYYQGNNRYEASNQTRIF